MKTRTAYLNEIITANGYTSYLEIGIADGGNFRAIKCENKTGVDPEVTMENVRKMDSDSFFEQNKDKFDLIFIDGLHHAFQVQKDIINSWYCTKAKGTIVLHDVMPFTEEMQITPRRQTQWTGNVWRAWQGFIETYGEKVETELLPEKYGLGVIKKKGIKIKEGFVNEEMTYHEYRELQGK